MWRWPPWWTSSTPAPAPSHRSTCTCTCTSCNSCTSCTFCTFCTCTCSLAQVSAAEVLEVLEALHLRLSLDSLHLEEVQGVHPVQHLSPHPEEVQGVQHLNSHAAEVHEVLDLSLYPTTCGDDKARLQERLVAWEEGVARVEVGNHIDEQRMEERVEEWVEEPVTEAEEELESGEGMEVEVAQTAEVEAGCVPAVAEEEEDDVKVVQLVVKDEEGEQTVKEEVEDIADLQDLSIGPRRYKAAARFHCSLCHHSSKSQVW